MDKYAEILLPLPLDTSFTYRIPKEMESRVAVGHRVIVPFGAKRFYTGIVESIVTKAPEGFEVKDIALALDDKPILRHPQLKLWHWIADYYLCSAGDVYKAAVPSGLKIESETFIEINPDYEPIGDEILSERESIIFQLLDHEGAMTVGTVATKTGLKNVQVAVNSLIDRGMIIISEKLVERYRPLRIACVRPEFDPASISEAFAKVKGAPKQEKLLLALIEMSGWQRPENEHKEVIRTELLKRADCTSAILLTLEKKGLLSSYKKEINRFAYDGSKTIELPRLSSAQATALHEIHQSWRQHDITLLHGVTSSGKTEIYQHLIADVIRRGDQALFLVPEIALTTQLTKRLQAVFGKDVIVYHSKFSDNERVDIWKRLLDTNNPCVVLGARSSVFLPFYHLGLVIVDEEHESSFKQYDPAPRYNARDVAIVLASMHGAKTLLGSATPSIETYYKATAGKFGLVSLLKRYNDIPLPDISVIDLHRARQTKKMSGTFSLETVDRARKALSEGNQIILFQPRRGYSPLARCRQCAWTPRCTKCDVALTYHRDIDRLICHYCGSEYPLPRVCPQCKEPAIETLGYGTERVEDEVTKLFPEKRILRLDLDTTRNKSSYETIVDDFSARKGDILVGTQMVTKGLDFEGVSLVGVLNADMLINFPDFRSSERAFNTIEQVAGRAGRREGQSGQVLIQSYEPSHPLFGYIINHDYLGFYNHEIAERERYFYPPFTRIIYLYLKHRDRGLIDRIAREYGRRLTDIFGQRIYGPERPSIERINNLYIRKIMLKVEVEASMKRVKEILREVYNEAMQNPMLKGLTIYYDVDPF